MADEKSTLKMKDINEALSSYQVQSLEAVALEGSLEMEMDISGETLQLLPQSLGQEFTKLAMQMFSLSRDMGYPVDTMVQTSMSDAALSNKQDG